MQKIMSHPKVSKVKKSECPEYEVVPGPDDQLPDSSVVLQLSELAENYSQCVPFRFQVVNGFMAENDKDPTISVDEVYSVHLVREIQVVVIKHADTEFKVPVNSSLRFGLIHENVVTDYDRVEDVLSAKKTPKVLAVLHKFAGEKFTLKKHEILLVKEAMKGKFGRSKVALRVFSMTTYKEIILPRDCDAQFTTDPQRTHLYLTDLIKYANSFMPYPARIYPVEGSSFQLTESLITSIVTIDRVETHRSVVVSLFRDNPSSKRKKETNFIDIPTSIDISVSILETDKAGGTYQRIYEESQNFLVEYNPSKIQACVDANTDDDYITQAQLLAEIRKEQAKKELADSAPPQYQKILDSSSRKDKRRGSASVSTHPRTQVYQDADDGKEAEKRRRGSSTPQPRAQVYQELMDEGREPDGNYSTASPTSPSKKKREKDRGKVSVSSSGHHAQASAGPKPSLDTPEPSNKRTSSSSAQSFQTPKVPPKPSHLSHPASGSAKKKSFDYELETIQMKEASKKKSFDYEQETLQLQDDGGDEDVSLTTDEKLSIWKKSFSGAEDKAKPPPVKPRKPTPHTRNEHEYEDPATFQSDSWFSDELDGGQQPKRSAKSAKPTKFEASVEDFSKDASFDDREKAVARSPSYPGSEEKSVSDEKSPYSRSSAHVDHREVQGGGSAVSAQLKSIEKKLGEVMSQISKIKERQIIFEEELFNITQRKASSAPEALPGVVAGMSPADVQATLSAAGLSQYADKFAREAVDGDMFMILDEVILAEELGITSRLHQLRILRMKGI